VPTWPQVSLSTGFTHVQDNEPANPGEGETWYDLGENEAFVYDGASWHSMSVSNHDELGSVSAGQHRSDSNIRATVDGQVDAETVDGQHASEIGGGGFVRMITVNDDGGTGSTSHSFSRQSSDHAIIVHYGHSGTNGFDNAGSMTLHYEDGSSTTHGSGDSGFTTHHPHRNGKTCVQVDISSTDSGSCSMQAVEVTKK